MTTNSPQPPQKLPSPARFIRAMSPGLHEHFDDAAEGEASGDFLRALRQADRRQLLQPKDKA
jgi:hypothetical protein